MNKSVYFIVFLFGGTLYCLIEILYMGKTHISMLVAGGICFLVFYIIEKTHLVKNLFLKWVLGGAVITAVELITGIIVNIILNLNVWDYSFRTINLLGQISLVNSLGWIAMSIPGFALSKIFIKHMT